MWMLINVNFREFLAGSTIHGLSHIGRTKKLIRVAWIIVVSSGFTIAGFIIWNSLNNWKENPVATTISTHPIEQVSLPKIYVCPPKHTYTNLNQDIVEMKDVTLSNAQVEELTSLGSCDKIISNKLLQHLHISNNKSYPLCLNFLHDLTS